MRPAARRRGAHQRSWNPEPGSQCAVRCREAAVAWAASGARSCRCQGERAVSSPCLSMARCMPRASGVACQIGNCGVQHRRPPGPIVSAHWCNLCLCSRRTRLSPPTTIMSHGKSRTRPSLRCRLCRVAGRQRGAWSGRQRPARGSCCMPRTPSLRPQVSCGPLHA